jgi:hypothetical protein
VPDEQLPTARAGRARPRPLAALSLWLVSLALVAGCAGQRIPDKYTGSVKKNFIESCEGRNPDQKERVKASPAACTCTYGQIVKRMKFSRFKKINEDLVDKAAPLPADLVKIVRSCPG